MYWPPNASYNDTDSSVVVVASDSMEASKSADYSAGLSLDILVFPPPSFLLSFRSYKCVVKLIYLFLLMKLFRANLVQLTDT